MKLVPASCECRPTSTTVEQALNDIAYAARVCYNTENKVKQSKEQTIAFLKTLYTKGHFRPFEFGTYFYNYAANGSNDKEVLTLKQHIYNWILEEIDNANAWTYVKRNGERYYMTSNFRLVLQSSIAAYGVYSPCKEMYSDPFDLFINFINDTYEYSQHNLKRHTIVWHTSRAIADEFRTHVMLSSLMQSTRYCNYSDDKKYGGEIRICLPAKYEDYNKHKYMPNEFVAYLDAWTKMESAYYALINTYNETSECARAVLPLQTMTTLIQCGFGDVWYNFFNQRAHNSTGKAHPDAEHIARKAEEMMLKNIE